MTGSAAILSMLTKPRGRQPGSLCRFKCRVCGAVELVSGGSDRFRCLTCRKLGLGLTRRCGWLGKDAAGAAVAGAIRDGVLLHPKTLRCADCDKPAAEYEHRDYNRPLVVEPICRRCNLQRGPAIPLRGTVEELLADGVAPYRTRRAVEKLCATMGRPEVAAGLPRTLTVDHWRAIWPQLSAPVAQAGA